MADRRRRVARLRLRGLTQREIVKALPRGDDPLLNPDTGKPYELATVCRDLKAIQAEWRASYVEDIGEHKARHLAELREVRRAAWSATELGRVLKSLAQEAQILGLAEAEALANISVNVQNSVQVEREQRFDRLYDALDTARRTQEDENGSGGNRGESVHPNGSRA